MKDKFCLDSIVPFQIINQSPTNRSTSKQTFSFSKSSRFDKIKPKYNSSYSAALTIPMLASIYLERIQVQV